MCVCVQAKLDSAAAAASAAFHVCPSFEVLVDALLTHGPEGLKDRCVYIQAMIV